MHLLSSKASEYIKLSAIVKGLTMKNILLLLILLFLCSCKKASLLENSAVWDYDNWVTTFIPRYPERSVFDSLHMVNIYDVKPLNVQILKTDRW